MNNSKFYKIGIAISILLVAVIALFIVLANKSDNKIAEEQGDFPSVMSSSNVIDNEETSTSEEEFKEISSANNSASSTDNKVDNNNAVSNTNKTSSNNAGTSSTNANSSTNTQNTASSQKVADAKSADPVFSYPVDGEISVEYAKDKLVYSNTLGEWITHTGIDINAEKTTVVKASADGTVKSIKNDPRFGLTIVIEHTGGYSTVYSNLLTAEFVNVGEKVTSGQTIGTVGNTASFEILDESHLHFEILKDGEQIDPNMYLKN